MPLSKYYKRHCVNVYSFRNNMMYSRVEYPQGNIHLINVYFNPRWVAEEVHAPARQVTWICEMIMESQAGFNHCIVAGDFNDNGMKELRPRFEALGYGSLQLTTRGNKNLDEIFFSPGLKLMNGSCGYVCDDSIKVFDHCAIEAEFSF